jgi:hypothetical protein
MFRLASFAVECGSLTTEYPANGSSFRSQTHAVFKRGTVADKLESLE